VSTLLNRHLPPEAHARLKMRALRNRRSLSEEAACLLGEALAAQVPLAAQPPSPFTGVFPLSDEWLDKAKNEGRT
jgi:hypothetical protein